MSGAWARLAPRSPLPLLGALLAAYLLVPFVAFAGRLAGTPAAHLRSPGVGSAVWVSVQSATISTALIAVFGIPLAYLLARGRSRRSTLLGIAVQLPLALPPLMSGILLLYIVGPYSTLGRAFGGRLTDDLTGIVLAQVFVAAPFLIVAARSAFAAVDPALDEVAATLGHGPWARFSRVAVSVAAPGIGAGLLLAWLRAFGEFGATVVLAYHPYSLPVFTYVQFGATGLDATLEPVAAAVAAALALLALAALAGRVSRHAPAAEIPAPRPPAAASPGVLRFDLAARQGSFTVRAAHAGGGVHLAILGPSGAGKTLTLRALAGLAATGHADVRVGAERLDALSPQRRGIGYLPQDSALLPGRTVWEQVCFGVGVDEALAAHWLARLGLSDLARRRPEQLSGGQRRRVALVRALARAPRLLILDEPFTGLDTPTRDDLRRDLRRLQQSTPTPTVLVTHDPEDAALLADDVLLLQDGRVLQSGSYAAVRDRPASPAAARLLGRRNVFAATVGAGGRLRVPALGLDVPADLPAGTPAMWSVPAHAVALPEGAAATVLDAVHRGRSTDVTVSCGGTELVARVPAGASPPGARVGVRLDPTEVRVWRADPAAAPLEDREPS